MVGLRVECDVAGCGRHFDIDAVMSGDELVDLSANTPRSVALELFVELPEGWRCEGNALAVVPERRFRVWCREHARGNATRRGSERLERRLGARFDISEEMRVWLDKLPDDVLEMPAIVLVHALDRLAGSVIDDESRAMFVSIVRHDVAHLRAAGRLIDG